MYKAKALDGERAGEFVFAKEHGLTHELCQQWKLVCPECRQFLYFNESKEPEIRRSWFSHPDNEDKNCPERNSSIKDKANQGFLGKSHEQDLEAAESFIEQVFYGIDPEYFQNLSQQEEDEENQYVTDAIQWFKASFQHDCKNWIYQYCQTTGFLDWSNPDKEVAYLMDWLYVLARREDILKRIARYFTFIYSSVEFRTDANQSNLGFLASSEKEEELIWIIAVEKIIERLTVVAKGLLSTGGLKVFDQKTFMDMKIPVNCTKIPFSGKSSLTAAAYWIHMGPLDGTRVDLSRNYDKDFIFFIKKYANHFFYASENYQKSEKFTHAPLLSLSKEELLLLYIDRDGDLSVKGFAWKQEQKLIVKGISKLLFNKTHHSLLFYLDYGYISKEIAEKAAQLALKMEYGDLSPSESLEKFEFLTGNTPGSGLRCWLRVRKEV